MYSREEWNRRIECFESGFCPECCAILKKCLHSEVRPQDGTQFDALMEVKRCMACAFWMER